MLPTFCMAAMLSAGPLPQEAPPQRPVAVSLAANANDAAQQRREAMQHFAAGCRVPATAAPEPTGEPPARPARRLTPTAPEAPETRLSSADDRKAITHFEAAAACGSAGSAAVIAHAATAPQPNLSQRALVGVLRAWRTRPQFSDRTGELLTNLVEHPDDDTAALACALLAQQIRAGYRAPLATFLRRALAELPDDRSELMPAGGMAPAPGMVEQSWLGNRTSRLVLLAMHTGDPQLIQRVAAPLTGGSTWAQVNQHAHFTLLGLAIAAPHVDAATAEQIHGWYMPHVTAWDPRTTALTTWHCGVLATLTSLHPVVPARLLPSYARLREWPLLRDHVEQKLGGLRRP